MNNLFFWWFWLPLSLFLIVFIVFVVAKIMHNKKTANASLCFMIWMTISFIFPTVAKREDVIKKTWVAVLLMFLSPPAIATYTFVATSCFNISSCPYEELKFTDRQSLISLTSLPFFPEFEYQNNSYDSWDGTHYVRFAFKDEPDKDFFQMIETQRNQKDNLFWSVDTLRHEDDRKFFGSDFVFIFARGWDGKYIPAPSEGMPENAYTELIIGKKSFVCRYSEYNCYSCDRLGDRDSISDMTGVRFPPYKSVNCSFHSIGPDMSEDWIIQLDKLPSNEFIRQIQSSSNWKQMDDGTYKFEKEHPRQEFETIYVKPDSKIVNARYWTM